MLTKEGLLEEIGRTLTKTKIVKLKAIVNDQTFRLTDLIDITFYTGEKKVAFRAAWLLEHVILKYPHSLLINTNYLINAYGNITNPSCARHYAKIARHITSPKVDGYIKDNLSKMNMEPVIDKCFSWMIDPKTLVAVKVFAAEALFNLSARYPWIADELKEQLLFLMKDGSAAMQSRGKKLLHLLA